MVFWRPATSGGIRSRRSAADDWRLWRRPRRRTVGCASQFRRRRVAAGLLPPPRARGRPARRRRTGTGAEGRLTSLEPRRRRRRGSSSSSRFGRRAEAFGGRVPQIRRSSSSVPAVCCAVFRRRRRRRVRVFVCVRGRESRHTRVCARPLRCVAPLDRESSPRSRGIASPLASSRRRFGVVAERSREFGGGPLRERRWRPRRS